MMFDCKLDQCTLSSRLNSAGCLCCSSSRRTAAEQSCRDEGEQTKCVPGGEGGGGKRERETPARSPTRGAVVLASRLGWDTLPKFWSSATLCFLLPLSLQRKEEEKPKKSEVVRREGVGRKGRKESQTHGRVWSGEEQREARHRSFFCACTFLHLHRPDDCLASSTSPCIVCHCDITKGTDISRAPPPTGTHLLIVPVQTSGHQAKHLF